MLYAALFFGILVIILTGKAAQISKSLSILGIIGQISAALIMIMIGKLEVRYILLGNLIDIGYLTIPFTLLLLIGLTNVMNIEKGQNNSILFFPFVSFSCFSLLAYFTGNSFVFKTGMCSSLIIIFLLVLGAFSGKQFKGRNLTTSIGFLIAVVAISFIQASILAIYIPLFTLALPMTLYSHLQVKLTAEQSTAITSLTAILFGVLLFIIPSNMMWVLLVGLTILLVIMQFSRKYRFI
ncbi:UDP-N-acetylmuramyl pentapeptide phosphotransferase [Falsibacillus pallidus]|uniref:UDP-N-acetylmuramyl pentapeptide phosphotransferase n=1 Tax=Falsibacillus pallidus TaxID=493781 RepID=UPI003D99AD68